MKIGIYFNPFDKGLARFDDKFSKISKCGFSAVDYNMADTNTELYTLDYEKLKSKMFLEREDAKQHGIEISQVHGPWRWQPQDATYEQRAERMEKMKKSILLTEELGCKNWVIHPIMPYGVNDANTDNAQKTWDLNYEFMTHLLEFAKKHNVTICLENMPMLGFSMARPSQILKFVKEINDNNFKICLDTGHVAVFQDLSLGDVVRELGKEIKVLHIHDNMGDVDTHLKPTYGCINWKDFATALKEIDFDDVFSLETLLDESLDDISFEKECVDLCNIAKSILNNY